MKQPEMRMPLRQIHQGRMRQALLALGVISLLALAIFLTFTLYTNRHELFVSGYAEHYTFRERLEKMAVADPGVSSEAYLEFSRSVPFQSRKPDEEALAIFVRERSSEITAYPCSSCHIQPLEELKAQSAQEGQLAHWEIQLNHAGEEVMSCATCHNLENLDELRTLSGASVSFDASYQTCAQCHTPQYHDWLGGAHGKRVGGWAEPRVMNSCTDCHNPHEPSWDIRWPAVPPQQVGR
jgi:hypothetical protein